MTSERVSAKYVRCKRGNQFRNETLADKIARFEQKVSPEPNSGCWLWTGSIASGYAMVSIAGKPRKASRVSYEFFKGIIPDGMMILHSCDNPLCVNPDHLRPGTQSENMREMHMRRRHKATYQQGANNASAKLTEAQVREIRFGALAGTSTARIAAKFGVSRSAIDMARTGKTWRHVHA